MFLPLPCKECAFQKKKRLLDVVNVEKVSCYSNLVHHCIALCLKLLYAQPYVTILFAEPMLGVAPPKVAGKQRGGTVGRGRAKKKLSMGRGTFQCILIFV